MDHRKEFVIPNEFACVLRSAGANLRDSEFEVAYAIAAGGVDTIALLAHTDCGMSHVLSKREPFIEGLVQGAGWTPESAAEHLDDDAHRHRIGDPSPSWSTRERAFGHYFPPFARRHSSIGSIRTG